MVDPHGSVDYFREFNGRPPTGTDQSRAYLVSLNGELWVTDGQEVESITLYSAPPEQRDVVLPFPPRWRAIPPYARVVRHP